MQQLHFRSIWISDTHLGGRNVKSAELYEFLRTTESEYLYLVGDILDLWKLKRNWHWPEINTKIVNLILRKAGQGTTVFYLPGNHDAMILLKAPGQSSSIWAGWRSRRTSNPSWASICRAANTWWATGRPGRR